MYGYLMFYMYHVTEWIKFDLLICERMSRANFAEKMQDKQNYEKKDRNAPEMK